MHKKLFQPELLLLPQICTKSFVGWGFAPDTTAGAYSAPPNPLAGLEGGAPGEREGGRRGRKEGGEGRGGSLGMPKSRVVPHRNVNQNRSTRLQKRSQSHNKHCR